MNNTYTWTKNGQMIKMVEKNIGTPKIHKESSRTSYQTHYNAGNILLSFAPANTPHVSLSLNELFIRMHHNARLYEQNKSQHLTLISPLLEWEWTNQIKK